MAEQSLTHWETRRVGGKEPQNLQRKGEKNQDKYIMESEEKYPRAKEETRVMKEVG